MKAALFVIIGAALVAALLTAMQHASESAESERAAARASAAAADDARRRAYEAQVRREQLDRVARTEFHATRHPAGDERCRANGKPPNGYIFGGSTYADNVAAAATIGCTPVSDANTRSTPFYCCARSDLPTVPRIQLP